MSSVFRRLTQRNSKKLKGEENLDKNETSRDSKEITSQSSRIGASLFQPKLAGNIEQSQDLDRTLYEMPMPSNHDAMTDLIKLHQKGDKFPYVGIVGNTGETVDARRSRMLALKPTYNLRNVPEIEVTGCELVDPEGEFNMTSLMDFAKKSTVQPQSALRPRTIKTKDFTITKRYVHIKSITGLYTPNMSSTADFCKLWFQLIDTRLVNNSKTGQSNAIVSNQEGVMEMSCDYCVNVRDLDFFILSYTLEREIVKPGFQWGTINFYFNIVESDIPYQSVKRDALAVYRMPFTTLSSRMVSADKSDITFTPNDLVQMRELFQQGDIVDVDEPQQARFKRSAYTSTTIRDKPKGDKLDVSLGERSGWEQLRDGIMPLHDAATASIDPDEEGSIRLDSVDPTTLEAKKDWENKQAEMRLQFEKHKSVNDERVSSKKETESTEKVVKFQDQEELGF